MSRHIWVALLVSGGCASALTKADGAFERGDYERAADMYEQLPSRDSAVNGRMQEARRRALAKRIDVFEKSKPNTDAALGQLSVLLARKLDWPLEAAAFTPRLDAAVEWGSARVAADVDANIAAHRPRAAQQSLAQRARFLQSSDFRKLRANLDTRIHAEGQARCSALDAELTTPFLRHFASAYCKSFEVPWPQARLPLTIGRFDVDQRIDGLTATQHERVVAQMNAALRETPWYSPSSQDVAIAHVDGKVVADFHAQNVTMTAAYTVSVPYTVSESYQEPYQESYQDTEFYTEQVPHTVFGSESYSCGTYDHPSTCTRSTTHTEYQSQSRTRSVTKYRTAYRTEWRTVTRYRQEDRTHEYPARQLHGNYFAEWVVALERDGWPALATHFQRNANETDVEHDETFEEANLYPRHPTLHSRDQWADRQLDDLTTEVTDAMMAGWTKAYCTQASYEPEDAARCVFGMREDAPTPAKESLRKVFQGDELRFTTPRSP